MPSLAHKDVPPESIHSPFSFIFENQQERLLLNSSNKLDVTDLWKFGLQKDDLSIWWLSSITPVQWIPILLAGDKASPIGEAGGALTGTFPNPLVKDNSHRHTPGLTIPEYPTSLPPSGPAGGDFIDNFPNPKLAPINGLEPGIYTQVTVDSTGRVTKGEAATISDNIHLSGAPTTTTSPLGKSSKSIATTEFVLNSTQSEVLIEGMKLVVEEKYQKVIEDEYTVEGILEVNGKLIIKGSNIPSYSTIIPFNKQLLNYKEFILDGNEVIEVLGKLIILE